MELIIVILCRVDRRASWLRPAWEVSPCRQGRRRCATTCVNVYRVKGGNGKELIYCNYTSDLREINFEVCECTGYRSNNIVPLTRVIGFAPVEGLSREEAFPAVAIRIERD